MANSILLLGRKRLSIVLCILGLLVLGYCLVVDRGQDKPRPSPAFSSEEDGQYMENVTIQRYEKGKLVGIMHFKKVRIK
jgi:hypothetical protein